MDNKRIEKNRLFKIVRNVIISFVILYTFFSLIIYTNIINDLERTFYDLGENYVKQTSIALEDWIDNQIEIAKFIANDSRVINACCNPENEILVLEAQKYLLELNERYPYYENLPLVTNSDIDFEIIVNNKVKKIVNGSVFVDTVGGETVGLVGENYSFVTEILNEKKYYISKVYPSVWRGNPIFVISVPVKKNGILVGIAVISPQMDYFTKRYIDRFEYKDTGYLFFLDDRGMAIAHKNRDYILNDSEVLRFLSNEVLEKVLKGELFFKANFLDVDKHYSINKINISEDNIECSWYVGFTQADSEIFYTAHQLLRIIMGTLVITAVLLSGMVYYSAKSHYKEIEKVNLLRMNEKLESKIKERTIKLKQMAVTDSLTNLYNHKSVIEKLENEVFFSKESGRSLVVLMIDLDYFKRVNDLYGHQVGDRVLIKVANTIKINISNEDIAGRYGGEEFIVILKNKNTKSALDTAERLREAIESLEFSISELRITASIGCCKRVNENAMELVKLADELLYQAKQNGRNRIEFLDHHI